MGMPDLARTWTREEVLDLPEDGHRYELVDGELLVTPAPRLIHQVAVDELRDLVKSYVQRHRLGAVFAAPADLDLGSGQLVQPDLFVSRLVDGRRPDEWSDIGIPLLIAEVLSPSTARADRFTKRIRYQRSGVPTYWIVHPEARMVEVWTAEAETGSVADDRLEWRPDPAAEPLMIDLAGYFRSIWED